MVILAKKTIYNITVSVTSLPSLGLSYVSQTNIGVKICLTAACIEIDLNLFPYEQFPPANNPSYQ